MKDLHNNAWMAYENTGLNPEVHIDEVVVHADVIVEVISWQIRYFVKVNQIEISGWI